MSWPLVVVLCAASAIAGGALVVVLLRERLREGQQLCLYADELEGKNRALGEAQTQLVQAEKMAALGALVAGVAHEINTPVGAIAANADLARRSIEIVKAEAVCAAGDRLGRAISVLDESVTINETAIRRIVGIVRTLRTFARLDDAEVKSVDLHDGIESTLSLLQHELKGIEIARVYGTLPKVTCHPGQLNQVFMNLLDNAAQATPEGGTITIRTRQESGQVVVGIEDTGGGIAPETLGRIFDPGFTTKGVGVGTGLGLAISYRIVDDHGGSIDVQSEPGQGTRFTVQLPIERRGARRPA